ncbi:SIS domain-containing protein [Chitinimonas koreensis]|uniref:SIS domain-containing protein n=1 Tax=Chitinimonas koreensis TaxID=356302 RepID=UPI0004037EEB|nr:SIS domain-containing protein [Chitinimonas koreensis]QNM95713.1 SIS domain-containing protein [Chitinimonas koreensis]
MNRPSPPPLLLQRDPSAWLQLGGLDTAREIAQQPAVWRALADTLAAQQARIEGFLGDWLAQPGHRVILTGAGSSAYIGQIAADSQAGAWPAQVRAIASTSLLTHPECYLTREQPTLLVSFARSGNSPESLAAVALLRQRVASVRFLNITCNPDGALLRDNAERDDSLNLLMPAGSCDRGFAMTSSFSAMLLAALAVLERAPWRERLERIRQLAGQAESALADWSPAVAQLAWKPYERVVYLGSGPLEALAREAALKVLELTGGRALAIADTPLGFRHGPKSMLNPATVVLMFRSVSAVAQRYEQDLLDELRRDRVAAAVLSIGPGEAAAFAAPAVAAPAVAAAAGAGPVGCSDGWLAPLWLLVAQQFALHQSVVQGLTPDNPFPDGTVNRVVQGVTIHSHDLD